MRFWSNISRHPDEKNEMETGCQHSRRLVFKHVVVAIHDSNDHCNNSWHQPRCPGAAEKNKIKNFKNLLIV